MPNESSTPPPYVGFGVFKSTIDELAETTVPSSPLERRVLAHLSGGDYKALMPALRFLGLIDDQKKANETFRELVEISKRPDDFKGALSVLIDIAYKPLIGDFDWKNGSASDLESRFRKAGVAQGQMLTKTTRFYVKALQECGEAVSPHITKPKPRTPRAPVKTQPIAKPAKPSGGDGGNGVVVDAIPPGFARMPVPGISDGFVQYPDSLTDAQCEMYAAVVNLLRAYAKGLTGGGGNKA